MHRLIAMVVCLLFAFSIGMSAAANAAELVSCSASMSACSTELDGGSDKSPAGEATGCLCLHCGCHGHQVGVSITSDPVAYGFSVSRFSYAWKKAQKAGMRADPALRPPQV